MYHVIASVRLCVALLNIYTSAKISLVEIGIVFVLVLFIMRSKIEHLSVELWLEILGYLKFRHQFNAFFNLNSKLNQILLSYPTKISCKNNDEDAQYLLKNILPYLTHRNNVTGLRLENTNKVSIIIR